MKFFATRLPGAYVIEPERIEDERGFFARSFCIEEFSQKGLNLHLVQCNVSFNKKKGTLRGMHYQKDPHGEVKLVRCTLGSIYDVIVDLRMDSPTYKQWAAIELSSQNRKMLYIPEGFAHGFQTLEEGSEVFYQMSTFYAPAAAMGVRWNDPAFNIQWPEDVRTISLKDQQYTNFKV
jgi:dTDP-4-dehydrorhamnose 3,5-epimerase